MNVKEKYKITIDNILVIAYFVSFWIRFFTDLSFIITSIVWFIIGCIIALYSFMNDPTSKILWIVLFITDLIAFVNAIINQNGKLSSVFVVFIAQAFGVLLYKNKNDLDVAEKLSLTTIIYLFVKILVTRPVKISSWEYGIVLSKLVGGNSASIISCMCLSIYLLNRYNASKEIKYWPFLICLFSAFKTGGNGGILSSLVFVILVFFLDNKTKKFSKRKMLIFSVVMIIVVILGKYYVYILQLITNDNSRLWMWGQYWECTVESLRNLLCGTSVDSVEFLAEQKNMHNTYINWHYCFGFIPFLVFLYLIFRSTLMYIIEKKHVILVISGVLFLRAATDEASFSFMTIWTYMWFDLISNKRKYISDGDLKES